MLVSAIVEVKGLVKRHGAVTAVDGISFAVEEGALFAFLSHGDIDDRNARDSLRGHRDFPAAFGAETEKLQETLIPGLMFP